MFFFFFIEKNVFIFLFFFFQAEDGIRDKLVTGVQTCALPISAFRRRFGVKALHFRTPDEAMSRAREAAKAGLEVMLQEYVPGPPSHHYMVEGFVDRTGRVCARFVRQRLRMFPPDFGDSTYMVSVSLDRVRAAVDSLDRLLAHLSYRGVFEAEFKYDAR